MLLRKIKANWLYIVVFSTFCYSTIELGVLLLTLLYLIRHSLVKAPHVLVYLTLFFAYSVVVATTILGYPMSKGLQQYVLLTLYILIYYSLLSQQKANIEGLFIVYLKVAKVIGFLGFAELCIYAATHIDIFSFTLWAKTNAEAAPHIIRVHATLAEGGYYGTILSPFIAYIILYKDKFHVYKRWQLVIIFISLICSVSAIAYLTFAVCLATILYRKVGKGLLLKVVSIAALIGVIAFFASDSKENESEQGFGGLTVRFQQTATALSSLNNIYVIESLNNSSYALLANTYVATHAPLRWTGTGLGTHKLNYHAVYQSNRPLYGLNDEDGYSLFNRLLSETGILGLLVYIVFLFKYRSKQSMINTCVLFYLLGTFIRGGNYFVYGMIFYNMLYYFSYKNTKITQRLRLRNKKK